MKKVLFILMVACLALAVAAPSFAGTTIGGRVVTQIGWQSDSEERTQNGDTDIISGFLQVSAISYIRVVYESEDKKVGIWTEIGLGSTVTRRPVFGWYTIGNCKIVAGNNYTWAGDSVIGVGTWLEDPTVGGLGLTYHGRRPMIGLEWRSGEFGVQVAVFEPQLSLAGTQDFRWVLPTLNVTVDAKFGAIQIAPSVGIVHYLWEADSGDDDLVAWQVALPANISFGPVSLRLAVSYAVNGSADFGGNSLGGPVLSGGEVEDSEQYGAWAEVRFNAGPARVDLGGAFTNIDNDTYATDITQYKLYIHVWYNVTENFALRPAVTWTDFGDTTADTDAGSQFIVGLRFWFVF